MKTCQAPEEAISGQVDKLYFSSAQFSAGILTTGDDKTVRFAAQSHLRENEQVTLIGQWTNDSKYGKQFQAYDLRYELPLDEVGLAKYLAQHPDIKGIGPAKAKRLAKAFGKDFDRIIREEPEKIAKTIRLSKDNLHNLIKVWEEASTINSLASYLAGSGLTHYQISSLVKKYGHGIKSILAENPYILVKELRSFGFRRVDDIALKLKIPKTHPERIKAGIIYVVRQALENEGHTCLDRRELVEAANTLLVMDSLDSRDRIEKAIDELVSAKELVEIGGEVNLLLASRSAADAEKYLITQFTSYGQATIDREEDISELIDHLDYGLNPNQEKAALTALTSRISIISGGAGVGKTYTIQAIVEAADELDLSVELAAPTGKAAKRIEQVVGRPARTVHRLLEYHPEGGFQRNEDYPLDADLVIIDEVSMLDIFLAKALFEALDFEETSIIFVGDHNQLPPVGPGNILRDLIVRKLVPVTILDEVVRQAGILKDNCSAILKGEVRPPVNNANGNLSPWSLMTRLTEPESVMEVLLAILDTRLEKYGLNLITDVQILAPQRKGVVGINALNLAIQKLLQQKLNGVYVEPTPPNRRPKLYPGDKIIQTKNDYSLCVMNGEMGYVKKIERDGTIIVTFENGVKAELEPGSPQMRNISLAYALTVHKCQGAEFPCVIAIIHKSHSYMHDRCLFYTAVTRAQKYVVILGDSWGIRNCASKVKSTKRNTLLSQEIIF